MTKVTSKGLTASAAILLIFCACFMVGVGLAAAAPSVLVNPQTNEYDAGDTFQVTVDVNSDTENLRAVNLQLNYDASTLMVNSVTDEDLLGAGALVAPGSGDDGAGTISYALAETSASAPITPVDGTMLTIEFEVKTGAANGTYDLDLNTVEIMDETYTAIVGVTATDGTVKIGDLPDTVVDIIVNSPDHETLEFAVGEAGLVGALSGDGAFTVFAPTDAAFDALPDGLLADLVADPTGNLTDVLLYHVLDGKVMSTDLTDGMTATTLLGEDITVTIVGDDVFINDAMVTVADLEAENGVVHVIDAVLIPPEGSVGPEVVINPVSSGPVGVGDTFQVTVDVNSDIENLRAVNLQLNYDASTLMVNNITDEDLLGAGALVAPGSGDDGAGTISYGLAETSASAPITSVDGTMLTIEFEVKAGATDGTYDLDLDGVELKDQDSVAIPGVLVTDGTVGINVIPPEPSEPEVLISPVSSGPVDVGETFQVTVDVNSDMENLRAVNLKLNYDASTLMVNNITDEDLLGAGALVAPGSGDDGAGTISYGLAETSASAPITPVDGTMLTIELEVKAGATDGTYNLDLDNVIMKDQDSVGIPGVTVSDGTVTVSIVPVIEGIVLMPGWNLISFPETLDDPSMANVLQDFDSTVIDSVFYDDASTGNMTIPTDFEPLKAYWIHNNLTEDVVINEEYLTPKVPSRPPSLMLYPGWNAVGHTTSVELSAEMGLASIDDCYSKVKGPWMSSTNEYEFIGYNGAEGIINGNHVGTDIFTMNTYEGFYVFVDEECILA